MLAGQRESMAAAEAEHDLSEGPPPFPKTFADALIETVCKCDLETEQVAT